VDTVFVILRALVYGSAFAFAIGWIALQSRALDPQLGGLLPPWTQLPSVVLMTTGAALMLACVGTFAIRGRGTPAIFDPPREFVAVGPYRWIRNPMLIGFFILLLGFGLFHRSPAILLLMAVFAVAFHLFVMFYEEPGLKRRFGPSYERYLESTPRWIPRVR